MDLKRPFRDVIERIFAVCPLAEHNLNEANAILETLRNSFKEARFGRKSEEIPSQETCNYSRWTIKSRHSNSSWTVLFSFYSRARVGEADDYHITASQNGVLPREICTRIQPGAVVFKCDLDNTKHMAYVAAR